MMRGKSLLFFIMIGVQISLRADQIPVIGTPLSSCIGKAAHIFLGCPGAIQPENEKIVRQIAAEMGITQNFTVHKSSLKSPCCGGNRLFVDDQFFIDFKEPRSGKVYHRS